VAGFAGIHSRSCGGQAAAAVKNDKYIVFWIPIRKLPAGMNTKPSGVRDSVLSSVNQAASRWPQWRPRSAPPVRQMGPLTAWRCRQVRFSALRPACPQADGSLLSSR
jgi:hypothetical protein